MIVEDARKDPRFARLAVTADVNIGSYIGAPIYMSDGSIYGTLCAIDPEPWAFDDADKIEQLTILSRLLGFVIEQERRLQTA